MKRKTIQKGVYVVVDPEMEQNRLIGQLKKIRGKPISAIQLWNNPNAKITSHLIEAILALFKNTDTPILINNEWEYLNKYDLDGVHFDEFPTDLEQINKKVKREFIKGITLTNDLEKLAEIEAMGFDYLSFCSVFPSATSNSCDLVDLKTIQDCREQTNIPIFLSGGITPENLNQLCHLNYDGVAIVSGIMKAADPEKALENYLNELKQYQ